MIMCGRVRLMGLAMIVVAMAPKHELFEHEEHQDTSQHDRGNRLRRTNMQSFRQDFQKGCTEQSADRIGNQHIDPVSSQRNADRRSRQDTQHAPGDRNGDDPVKSAHGGANKR